MTAPTMTQPPTFRRRIPTALVLASALLGMAPASAAAQYFGGNKVQYETFNFKILQTEHFDVYYYPETRQAALLAGRMAERWYARLSRLFGHELGSRQPLIMYANHPHFEQTNAISGNQSEATGGVTEVFKRRIVLPFASGLWDTDHVIGHELVHAFQYDITGQGRSVSQGGFPGALRLPLWFIEGMAEYMSLGADDPNTAMWMRDQARRHLPTVAQMGDPYRWFPYRYGQAFWAYLAGRYGDEIVGRLLETAGRSNDPELAMSRILGATMEELGEAWHKSLRDTYAPLDSVTEPPTEYGTEVFGAKDVLNTAPTISPDGRRMAFISTRDRLSIDVYISDLETGKVIRKLTHTAVDPHFESLQFISSAGAWSPDGTQFALAAISHGRPIISIIDVESGDEQRVIKLPELGEIFTPTWSPDGRYIAFSALVGGLSDLFMYDLERDELRRLTNDPFGDLHPAWSPDGTRLAFVTDRFTTDLNRLAYGNYHLALLDPTTNAVTEVPAFATGKHISPQWTQDGSGLYFVSDRNGIDNVYRVRLSDGELRQITNLYTGVTGITPTSPTLSVAQHADRAIISVYADNGTGLYLIDKSTVLAGQRVMEPFASVNPALLPPQHPISDQLAQALADVQTGLPDTAEFGTKAYHPGLSLDYVSQPEVAVGVNSWGSYVGAGAALYWSDMLGNRNLITALQVNGGIKDIMAIVGYTNLRRRLNWGIFAQQIPYLASYYGGAGYDSTGAFVEQNLRFRQTTRDFTGLISYPLSRAQRIELSAGVRNIGFDEEIRTTTYDPFSGQKINQTTETIPTGFSAITTGIASMALVYDKTLFGATSPLLGQRYRLELSPSVGSLNYLGVLADYRRYVMPFRPVTLAARVLHYGRYGAGGEDYRVQPVYLGNQGLIRGYSNPSSFRQECAPVAGSTDSCPLYTRLLGSRLIVANAELRVPLLGALGVGSGYYGALPIEFLVFGDAGLAYWGSEQTNYDFAGDDRAWFFGGGRTPITSTGAGMRLNLLGFAILELDYAYAFQRNKWVWQFGFTPGF